MPEYIIAIFASICLGSYGWLSRRLEDVDRKIDKLQVKIAEEYVTQSSFVAALDRLEGYLQRVEHKLDDQQKETPRILSSILGSYINSQTKTHD